MQIPILNGIVTDPAKPGFRTAYPRNMVPVPKPQGISNGYLQPAEGLELIGTPALGPDRGGIAWNGKHYRVQGESLVEVLENGQTNFIGIVGPGTDRVSLDYSFDRLGIIANKKLFYAVGVPFQQVTDPELGAPLDGVYVSGYWFMTDGENLLVTELNDPTSVLPLKYGSSELDPDPVTGVLRIRDEVYAINRFTIEGFRNVGGNGFPWAVIKGARIMRGAVATHAKCIFEDAIAFLGSGRNESIGVYLGMDGSSVSLSTREIDQVLERYTEAELKDVVLEWLKFRGHSFLFVHLPDQCLVYDAAASAVAKEPVWHTRDSGTDVLRRYRAIGFVRCYDKWMVGDPLDGRLGVLVDSRSDHYGETIGWEFSTLAMYADGNEAQIHELELVALPGRKPQRSTVQVPEFLVNLNPVIWTSHSPDGVTWSMELSVAAGTVGDRTKRIVWLQQGLIHHWRIQRFRGNSDAFVGFARLEVRIEPLNTKRSRGG